MEYVKSPMKVKEAIKKLKTSQEPLFGLDIETNGLDPLKNDILLIQVGNQQMQFVFDVYRCGAAIFDLLDWLDSNQVTKVLHNAKFDLGFIRSKFNYDLPQIKCTYLAEKLLNRGKNSVKHGLDTVLNKYLNVKMDKEEQSSFVGMNFGDEFTDEQITYAGDDIKYLPDLYKEITDLLKRRNLHSVALLEYATVSATVEMEVNGIYLSPTKWLDLRDRAKDRLEKAESKLNDIITSFRGTADHIASLNLFGNPDINYSSPKQVKPIIEEVVGQQLPDTSSSTLETLDHPIAEALLDYREAHKKLTTYGEDFLDKNVSNVTKRVHSNFRQLGTDTGRYASSKPNLQNIPSEAEYRAAFCSQTPDYKIIAADFSNQELRLLAEISRDPTFMDATETGKDLHCMAASLLFDVPYEDFFDQDGNRKPDMDKKYRTPAKSLNFGLIYGMGPSRLADQLGITYQEARGLINKYFQMFPKIKQVLSKFEKQVLDTHVAVSPLDGRIIDLNGIDWDNPGHVAHAKNQAKNFPFQGAGASVTKLALCRIKRAIKEKGYDAKLLVTVHDEIVLEAYKPEAEKVAKLVEEEMIKAFNKYAPNVKMEVDAIISDHWEH